MVGGSVGTTQLTNDAVTADKLGNESTVDLVTTLPASGAFTGQFALDTDDNKAYIWDGSQWISFKAAGSTNSIVASNSGPITLTVTTVGDAVTIAATLNNTTGANEFLAGPTSGGGAVGYRQIAASDLPTATSGAKGAVLINGEGLRLDGNQLELNNDVLANATASLVTYDAKGLITSGRNIASSDLPPATSSTIGATQPGTGLAVSGSGVLNHSNTAVPGTFTKVTIDAQGHVTTGDILAGTDIPNHSAALLTSGTLPADRIGASSIQGSRLANYAVSKFGETQPVAEHIGQFFFNPIDRKLYLWDANVWQPIGVSFGELVFAGTYDAETNLVASASASGIAAGIVVGAALPAASATNSRYYLVVSKIGTGTAPAPQVELMPPDLVLSDGTIWTEIDISETIAAQTAVNVAFTPAGNLGSSNVQAALQELDGEKLAVAGGTMNGELLIGSTGSLVFEGTTNDAFETTLAVVDPTADRTVTLPNATGTVALTSDLNDGTY